MNTSKWIYTPAPNPSAPYQLFCFHYAGGSAVVFKPWADQFGPDVEVSAIQLPGRANRFSEPLIGSVDGIIDQLMPHFLAELRGPYFVFGHSLGGTISFELLRRLKQRGHALPVRYFASASRAPHTSPDFKNIHTYPQAEFEQELRKFNGTPEEILEHKELMELFSPVLRSDFKASFEYRCDVHEDLPCDASIYGGRDDERVSEEKLTAWPVHFNGQVDMHIFEGDHFYLNAAKEPLIAKMLNHMELSLERPLRRP